MKISFSFDDNHIKNLNLARLFSIYKFPATFFINIIPQQGHPSLTAENIIYLHQQGFEIGAHTVSHSRLPYLTPELIKFELTYSKKLLENLLDCEINGFCYPKGQYNSNILALVKEAGFKYARATGEGGLYTFNPYRIIPTVQIYNKPYRRLQRIKSGYPFDCFGDWRRTTVNFIEKYKNKDVTIRIFGHGWEIEQQRLWNSLSDLLDYIENKDYEVVTESHAIL